MNDFDVVNEEQTLVVLLWQAAWHLGFWSLRGGGLLIEAFLWQQLPRPCHECSRLNPASCTWGVPKGFQVWEHSSLRAHLRLMTKLLKACESPIQSQR